jgi:predicted RNA-binding Zn ribbon-like protein
MYRVLSGEPASADLDRLNDALRATPQRKALKRDGEGYAWQTEEAMPSTTTLLAPVLWSAGDLLTRPEVRRVRQCANDRCRWLFLDDSKNGSRRWCSMSMCGNRAKAHRHYLRTRHRLPSP